MDKFALFAQPWWVNLLVLVPFLSFFGWRRVGLALRGSALLASGVFALAFGFVEAAVVVYLRAATGLLPGYQGTLATVRQLSMATYRNMATDVVLPNSLATVEMLREAATIFMLASVALLVGRTRAERWAAFLWCFALWDMTYYAGLWATIGWPYSILAPDVLFLIPVPWIAQVWFPVLVSGLSVLAVLVARRPGTRDVTGC